MQTSRQLSKQYFRAALALLFTLIAIFSFAQKNPQEPVKVKIVKIVDGDTTIIEKSMPARTETERSGGEESSVQDFTKLFQDVKGRNVQVMVTVEGDEKDKGKYKGKSRTPSPSAMHLNFNIDSATANAIGKCFMFSDSLPAGQAGALHKKFMWHDSLMKGLPKDFNFNFNFDDEEIMKDFDFDFNIDTNEDGKTVIIKKNRGNTIIINGDEEDISISKADFEGAKAKTKTIMINDDKTKTKKKVIVTTSVVVIDMDDEKRPERKSEEKEPDNFSFYPNPSDGNFTLDMELNDKDAASVRIVDMAGKEAYNEKISGNGRVTRSINLDGKKGTFIVAIKQGKRMSSKKIIIE